MWSYVKTLSYSNTVTFLYVSVFSFSCLKWNYKSDTSVSYLLYPILGFEKACFLIDLYMLLLGFMGSLTGIPAARWIGGLAFLYPRKPVLILLNMLRTIHLNMFLCHCYNKPAQLRRAYFIPNSISKDSEQAQQKSLRGWFCVTLYVVEGKSQNYTIILLK